METRANYALIGSIVLALVVAIFGFIIWVSKLELDKDYAVYDILFESSVAGLTEGAPVRYKGISIGQVRKLAIDSKNPSFIRATIKVRSDAPIFEDTTASLDSQGFTGVASILLDTGPGANKPLRIRPGEEYPVIQVKPSQMQELFSSVPQVMAQASQTIAELHKLLGDENRALITSILKNVDKVSGDIAHTTPDLHKSLDNFNSMSAEIKETAAAYRQLASTLDQSVTTDLKPALADVHKTTQALNSMAADLEGMVADSRGPITAFTNNTLPEAAEFISEARRLAATLSRVAERLERDPGEFLSQGKQPEYKTK
ncbi:MlaD family protein [Govanella unica]|uniref:MCE family protein n=1 Tax=Govanella unica TaxID=2975056 RepID=A0A9X3TXE0_9PROT|nr:MlaD family protein [Govania unica]MDA5193435.1 MCE family protein [Govania unica]